MKRLNFIRQPIENYSEWRLLYFIAFILLVGFFVLNMFVGVVVENFHRCREEQEKEERVRRAAKRALQMEKKRRSEWPQAPLGLMPLLNHARADCKREPTSVSNVDA